MLKDFFIYGFNILNTLTGIELIPLLEFLRLFMILSILHDSQEKIKKIWHCTTLLTDWNGNGMSR